MQIGILQSLQNKVTDVNIHVFNEINSLYRESLEHYYNKNVTWGVKISEPGVIFLEVKFSCYQTRSAFYLHQPNLKNQCGIVSHVDLGLNFGSYLVFSKLILLFLRLYNVSRTHHTQKFIWGLKLYNREILHQKITRVAVLLHGTPQNHKHPYRHITILRYAHICIYVASKYISTNVSIY